jgi:hypothetical protein
MEIDYRDSRNDSYSRVYGSEEGFDEIGIRPSPEFPRPRPKPKPPISLPNIPIPKPKPSK